jgi:8-hydroxy-5-deazaflavin:NADPH oxidoreductase
VIGIIGGTGDFGQGLAERLRRLGEEVVLGSRTPRDEFVSNAEATQRSDIVFLSVPPDGVEFMCRNLADELAGRIVVSVASPLVFVGGRPAAEPGDISLAEKAQDAAPRCRVVAGFHTVSAKALARVDDPLDEDVILCADDDEAKEEIGALAEKVVEGRAIDAGPLMVARWLEPVTAVILNVNRNYKVQSGVRITGIPT